MSPAEMAAHLAAQNKLIRQLLAATEALLAANGPDARQRRQMLELAKTITTVRPDGDVSARFTAAKQLAELVLQNISEPRPLGLPSTVDVDVTNGGKRVS